MGGFGQDVGVTHSLFDVLDVVVLASVVLAPVRLLHNCVDPSPIFFGPLDNNVLTFESNIRHVRTIANKLIVIGRNTRSLVADVAERPRNVKRSLVADVAFILHFLGRRMLHIFRKLIKRNSCTIFAVFCFGPAL